MNKPEKRILLKGGIVWGHEGSSTDLLISANKITQIGPDIALDEAVELVDVRGALVYPGLINSHHHLAQSLMKGIPAGINHSLNDWLGSVPYKCWPHFGVDAMYAAARAGLAELLRAGCTTCADHHYLYHADTSVEMEEAIFRAAEELGLRLVLCRGGSTTVGSHRGSKMASREFETETIDLCMERLEQTVKKHHDPSEQSMSRVVVAPTSLIHASSKTDLIQLAEFARGKGLRMHSHLLEVVDDEIISRRKNGLSAIDYAAETGWLGEDVWFAHMVFADEHGIDLLGQTGTGVAHCPTSNARLGSGIAPIPKLEDAGAKISLGVDGSASAESGSPINELMLAWLVHRTVDGPEATDVTNTLKWATEGGAEVLGFNQLGKLEVGMLADIAIYDLDQPRFVGLWEKSWAPIICGEPIEARDVMVNGEWRVRGGEILGLDSEQLIHDCQHELDYLKSKY